jgi:N6-adenosine-specific RNA methylase IME4
VSAPRRTRELARTVLLHPHPAVELVPEMAADEWQAFKSDIVQRGILQPLEVLKDNVVVDGRHRLRAARELKLARVPVRLVEPPDVVEHILLAASRRRNLSAGQLAALAVELELHRRNLREATERKPSKLPAGAGVATLPPGGRVREAIARHAGVSPRTVQDALTVYEHDKHVFAEVKAGLKPVHIAARELRRQHRHAAIAAAPALPRGRYDLVYADPPWRLGNPNSEYAPDNYYPTLPIDEIKALNVPAARDAVLFLWAVNRLLPEALEVMQAWGFAYRANISWDKLSIGQGIWTRGQHELLLIGVRGNYPPPTPRRRVSSVLRAKRGRHSEKPAAMYTQLERMYPRARKLELFARGKPRSGWTAWGNEVETAA